MQAIVPGSEARCGGNWRIDHLSINYHPNSRAVRWPLAMSEDQPHHLTQIFNAALEGDDQAARRMWGLIYEDLRHLAATALQRDSPVSGLEATQVVHEVFLRLSRSSPEKWDSRRHFFGAAIRAMEQFLVDHARERKAIKRGSGRVPVSISVLAGELADFDHATSAESSGLIAAIEDLDRIDPDAADAARLRWLMGLTNSQVALVLECPVQKVRRDWTFARAFLQRFLAEHQD
jgi:RNA polymerase sigma factor (TIGR02999 family)